jgi:hypothetical protein
MKIKRWLSPGLHPILFDVRNNIESIEAMIQLAFKHHSKVPAAPHQHKQVRHGHECRQGPQDVSWEAAQLGTGGD